MTGWNINVEIRSADVKYCLLSLSGALDSYSFPKLEETLLNLFDGGHKIFVINCRDLLYISSAGLGTLIGFAKKAQEKGGELVITNLSRKIHNIMDLLGFTTVFKIYNTEEEAVHFLKNRQ